MKTWASGQPRPRASVFKCNRELIWSKSFAKMCSSRYKSISSQFAFIFCESLYFFVNLLDCVNYFAMQKARRCRPLFFGFHSIFGCFVTVSLKFSLYVQMTYEFLFWCFPNSCSFSLPLQMVTLSIIARALIYCDIFGTSSGFYSRTALYNVWQC